MKGQGWLIVVVLLLVFLIAWLGFHWIDVDFTAIQDFFTGLLGGNITGGNL